MWTGIVAAVAGAALALVAQVVGQSALGLSIDGLVWLLVGFSTVGFILGAASGPRNVGQPPHDGG